MQLYEYSQTGRWSERARASPGSFRIRKALEQLVRDAEDRLGQIARRAGARLYIRGGAQAQICDQSIDARLEDRALCFRGVGLDRGVGEHEKAADPEHRLAMPSLVDHLARALDNIGPDMRLELELEHDRRARHRGGAIEGCRAVVKVHLDLPPL